MRITSLIASLSISLIACAADEHTDELPFEGDADEAGKADHATVAFTALAVDVSNNRLQRGGTIIMTSKAAWTRLMGTPAPANVDFSKEWVVFFGTGVKNTGGYGAEITELRYSASQRALVVSTKATSPGPDCIVTQAFTTPHHVVKMTIPSPRPQFALADAKSETRRCSPTNEERLAELAASREEWNRAKVAHGNSYTYSRGFQSWTGFSGETTLVVKNGVVTERHYKAQHASGGQASAWSEIGAQVGSHTDEGFPAVLVDALYDECRTQVLTQDETRNWMSFSVDQNGFLQACTYTPMECQDDCSRGPTISSIDFN